MYEVAIRTSFISQHFLTGGDWGAENQLHSHHFRLEVKGSGDTLDRHNYLFDIAELKKLTAALRDFYADKTLNDLPGFRDQNPSVELFCQIIFKTLTKDFHPGHIRSLKITLWEDDDAWASYEHHLS